jgi:pyruvate kinase
MANAIEAKAISTMTNSGYTAFQLSAWRPHHILVFTSNRRTYATKFTMGLNPIFMIKMRVQIELK